MAYIFTIEVTRTPDQVNTDAGCYVKVEVTDASGPNGFNDTNIFVYRQGVKVNNEYEATFHNVANPADMADILLIAEPDSSGEPQAFRLSVVEFYVQSRVLADETIAAIKADIGLLKLGLQQKHDVLETAEYTI